jgi:uncharacterized membrane protein
MPVNVNWMQSQTSPTAHSRHTFRHDHWASWAVIVLISLYVVFFSALSIQNHRAFMTHGFDLGNVDQAVWNTLHGSFLRMTNEERTESRLDTHVDPIIALLSPLYLIYSNPEMLLVVQTIALALGAWPVFRLTATRLHSDWGGTAFALVYLAYPALEGANLSEFHAVTLGAGLLAWAFYSLFKENYGLFGLFAVLAMSCKEDISLIVATMGFYAFFIQKKRKLGLAIFVAGILWFLLAVQVILPTFNDSQRSIHLAHYAYLGNSLKEVLVNIVTRPEIWLKNFQDELKISYLVRLCLPVGFLSLLAPQVLIFAVPLIAINFLSTHYTMYALDMFWGSVAIVPFLVISAGWGAAFLVRTLQRLSKVKVQFLVVVFMLYTLTFTLLYHSRFGYSPLNNDFSWPKISEHNRLGLQLARSIPTDAVVVAQDHLNPHVSQRRTVYIFPFHLDEADYIYIDVSAPPGYIVSDEEYQTAVNQVLNSSDFGIVHSQDGYVLLQRGAKDTPLSQDFHSFARAQNVRDALPLRVQFGRNVQLCAFQIIAHKAMTIEVHSYWQATQNSEEDIHLFIGLFDEHGAPLQDILRELKASAWYPPSLWIPGELVHEQYPSSFNPMETHRPYMSGFLAAHNLPKPTLRPVHPFPSRTPDW